jgi:WD40 repeat protein
VTRRIGTRVAVSVAGTLLVVGGAATAADASVAGSSVRCAQPNGRVSTSTVDGDVLYIGGSFTAVKDLAGVNQSRDHLAAIDLATCDVLPWTANVNGNVTALTADNGVLYAGGAFTAVEGQTRHHLAALDETAGAVLPMNPDIDKPVNALTISGTTLYAGGKFTRVDSNARPKLAAFDTTTGDLMPWKPTASGAVLTLTPSPDGSDIYVGGSFTSLDGKSTYPYLGAVDSTSGDLDTAFTPAAEFPILALAADNNGVYAGGGGHGGHLVIWNTDGSLQQPIYQTDGGVQAVAVDGNSLYAGGHFQNYCIGNTGSGSPFTCDNPLPRRKLFEVNLATGQLTDWAPRLNSPRGVFTEGLTATGDLVVGGDFTTINGVTRAHLGMFP